MTTLFAMLVLSVLAMNVHANEPLGEKASKTDKELKMVIPLGDDKAPASDKDIRSKMLSEKLIKMGRSRSQSCTRCHGRGGMHQLAQAADWQASVAEFVVKHLTALRDGTRQHLVMSSIAAPLSDQDIALIAAWYESVSPKAN